MSSYDTAPCRELEARIDAAGLHYRHAPKRYDPGQVLEYAVTGVHPRVSGRVRFEVERFVGAGFAGQVYRVRCIDVALDEGTIPGLEAGGTYAIKICVPVSGFSRLFRNVIFGVAYQAPFAYQVHASASRAGVLWQKLIRAGAGRHFGDPRCVADTYATFFDAAIGSYGEVNEWVDGRPWRFEIDDQVMERKRRDPATAERSPEYLAKRKFMAELVDLFHAMGAPELARQYEWWTFKSQPNVLKRTDADEDPASGLTALDFRAGLALLPFLPMSPGDFLLIWRGLWRGALVQFDRGDLEQLEAYCDADPETFAELQPARDELKEADPAYRAAQPDLFRHGCGVFRKKLRKRVRAGLIEAWHTLGYTDERGRDRLAQRSFAFALFLLLGLIPFLGKRLRRFWGHAAYRQHVLAFFTSPDYVRRTFGAAQSEVLLEWHRDDRVTPSMREHFLKHPLLFWRTWLIFAILPLPRKWQSFLTDWLFAWDRTKETVAYPLRFYRDAAFRVEWLSGEIDAGAAEGMLTTDERDRILARVPDPFIQKYLKCVAVHVCTLPITQVVSLVLAVWGYFYLGKTWEEGLVWAGGILLAFQATPVSPGSLTRGSYVVYLMIKERNLKNYWLAALVSFWHYIGYLGFPLQMVTEFPALARFMAGRWATKMVHFIPVFGEHGALLEHWIFDAFFNVPLSLRRRLLGTKAPTDEEEVE